MRDKPSFVNGHLKNFIHLNLKVDEVWASTNDGLTPATATTVPNEALISLSFSELLFLFFHSFLSTNVHSDSAYFNCVPPTKTTVGPVLVVKHMLPVLRAGGGSGTDREFAVIANLSARVGSIGDNRLGGWHSYRASKTALNQLTKSISVELARRKDPIISILLHPGTVDTDMSKPFQKNVPPGKLFTREFSVGKLLSIINNAKESDNGKFYAWDGQEIPW